MCTKSISSQGAFTWLWQLEIVGYHWGLDERQAQFVEAVSKIVYRIRRTKTLDDYDGQPKGHVSYLEHFAERSEAGLCTRYKRLHKGF